MSRTRAGARPLTARPLAGRPGSLAFAGVGALALAAPGLGYVLMGARWPGATADYRLSTQSFPAGSAQLAQLEAAFEAWHQVQGSAFRFRYVSAAQSGALDHDDGANGVAFSSQVAGSTLGVTFSSDVGGRRREADVLFNPSTRWSFTGAPTQREWDFGSTARHELGHALGLAHSDRGCAALMGGGCGANGRVRQITTDDANGVRALYPGTAPGPAPTPAAGPPPPARPDWTLDAVAVRPTTAAPGARVAVDLVLRNAGPGTADATPALLVVASSNQTITTQDAHLLRIPAQAGRFGPGARAQASPLVTVPATAAPGGTLWLGVIADPDGLVAEEDEGDNARGAPLRLAGGPVAAGAGGAGRTASSPQVAAADWRVERVTVSPDVAAEGEVVAVDVVIANLGADAAGAPALLVVLSDNAALTARDTSLLRVAEEPGAFPTGGRRALRLAVALPAGAAGAWTLGVLADPDDVTVEADEDDNAAGVPLTITTANPAAIAATTPPAVPAQPDPAASVAAGVTPAPEPPPSPTASAVAPAAQASAAAGSGSGGGGCALAPTSTRRGGAGAPTAAAAALLGLGLIAARAAGARAAGRVTSAA